MKHYLGSVMTVALMSGLWLARAQETPPMIEQFGGGGVYMCALEQGGALHCWGRLYYLGIGDEDVLTPQRLSVDDVAELGAGIEHLCVRKQDGTVWCWGEGANGRLGNGASESSHVPVQVAGIEGVVRVVSGWQHSCALLEGGGVHCWGKGGHLGVEGFANALTPVRVEGLTDILDIAIANAYGWGAGTPTTCALAQEGQVYCWGENREGALGTGDLQSSRTPITGPNIPGATRIYGGGQHFCVMTDSGEAYCWGANYYGQLGDGTKTNRLEAVKVQGLNASVMALALGDQFSCALDASGKVACWGINGAGQLGRGFFSDFSSTENTMPAPVVNLAQVSAIGAGGDTACAYSAGVSYCWGSNAYGKVGDGAVDSEFQASPTPVRW